MGAGAKRQRRRTRSRGKLSLQYELAKLILRVLRNCMFICVPSFRSASSALAQDSSRGFGYTTDVQANGGATPKVNLKVRLLPTKSHEKHAAGERLY